MKKGQGIKKKSPTDEGEGTAPGEGWYEWKLPRSSNFSEPAVTAAKG